MAINTYYSFVVHPTHTLNANNLRYAGGYGPHTINPKSQYDRANKVQQPGPYVRLRASIRLYVALYDNVTHTEIAQLR